jgi:type II secretory pathway pseudopilin PulG
MAMSLLENKKGESLVEVVVSLGIIIFLFSAVVSLLIVSVNLNLGARQRTEAIALAQRNMNDYIVNGLSSNDFDSGTCVIDPPISDEYFVDRKNECLELVEDDLDKVLDYASLSQESCDYFDVRTLNTSELGPNPTLLINDDNFVVVESHVAWYTKGIGVQDFYIAKLVRKQ